MYRGHSLLAQAVCDPTAGVLEHSTGLLIADQRFLPKAGACKSIRETVFPIGSRLVNG
jgi:hypothetical protein